MGSIPENTIILEALSGRGQGPKATFRYSLRRKQRTAVAHELRALERRISQQSNSFGRCCRGGGSSEELVPRMPAANRCAVMQVGSATTTTDLFSDVGFGSDYPSTNLYVSPLTCRSTLARVSSLHLKLTGINMISLHLPRVIARNSGREQQHAGPTFGSDVSFARPLYSYE